MNNHVKEITRLYQRILKREPDPTGLSAYLSCLSEGTITLKQISNKLRSSAEYHELVRPVVAKIEKATRLYCLRPPTEEEIRWSLSHFRDEAGDDDAARRIARSGNVEAYLGIRPLQIEMDITNACNLRCSMCFMSLPQNSRQPRKDLPMKTFERLAKQAFSGVKRLSLSYSTESLLHERFPEMAAMAKQYRIPNVYVNTNGTLLTRNISESMMEIALDAVNISLDGACKETVERLRRGAKLSSIIRNIKELNAVKAHHGSDLPRLSLSCVMMRSNIRELPAFIDLAHELEAHAVHLMHLIPIEGLSIHDESLHVDPDLCNRYLTRARARARTHNIRLFDPGLFPRANERNEPEAENDCMTDRTSLGRFDLNLDQRDRERKCCPFPWHFMGISAHGFVFPCGFWISGNPMGNIHKRSFKSIWQGRGFKRVRDELRENQLPTPCIACPTAGMGKVSIPPLSPCSIP